MLVLVSPWTVGPYEVLAVLGRGGVGTVHRARHATSGELVALKLLELAKAPAAAGRLARELEVLRRLSHENVVRALGGGVHGDYAFLAMELVDGLDLRAYLSPALDGGSPAPPQGGPPPGAGNFDLDAWADEPATVSLFGVPAGEHPTEAAPGRPPVPLPAPLRARLNRPGRAPRLAGVLRQVSLGLAHVHERGLVHRDLKPSNILVDGSGRARILDFGLAQRAGPGTDPDRAHRVAGTCRYMSPEQACGGALDGRSDLYSLGAVLFELLCGRAPFSAERPEDLCRELAEGAPPRVLALNPEANAHLAELADRLLQGAPQDRLQSAGELANALG